MPDPPSQDPATPSSGDRDPLEADLARCLAGDAGAWEAFVRGSAGLVHAAVRRAMGSSGGPSAHRDVDDTVQDVYVRLVRGDFDVLRRFDPGRARLSTWLTVVARSVAIDALRRRELGAMSLDGPGGAAAEPLAAEPDERPDPDMPTAADDPDRGFRVGSVSLHGLSERQRLVITLLFTDGRTVPEVAAILGVDEQTVRSTKHKALVRLRAEHAPARAPDD